MPFWSSYGSLGHHNCWWPHGVAFGTWSPQVKPPEPVLQESLFDECESPAQTDSEVRSSTELMMKVSKAPQYAAVSLTSVILAARGLSFLVFLSACLCLCRSCSEYERAWENIESLKPEPAARRLTAIAAVYPMAKAAVVSIGRAAIVTFITWDRIVAFSYFVWEVVSHLKDEYGIAGRNFNF